MPCHEFHPTNQRWFGFHTSTSILCACYIFATVGLDSLRTVMTGQRNRIHSLCQTYTRGASRSVSLRGMNGCGSAMSASQRIEGMTYERVR